MSVERLVSQAELARELGVSRAAVSQWKAKDILREDAFSEPGKSGKIILGVAIEQVRRNRDVGQSLGNGIATRTAVEEMDPTATTVFSEAQPSLPMPDDAPADEEVAVRASGSKLDRIEDRIEDQLKRAKLEEQLRRNRIQAADEAARQGLLMASEDARDQMARIAGMMLQIFEGALPDFASAMAAQFDLPQRDVLHLLRAEFKKVRKTASMKERALADAAEQAVTAVVDLEV